MGLEFTPRLLKEVYLADMERIGLELLSKLFQYYRRQRMK